MVSCDELPEIRTEPFIGGEPWRRQRAAGTRRAEEDAVARANDTMTCARSERAR